MSTTTRLNQALSQIEQWIDPAAVTGAQVVVRYGGELIGDHAAGEGQTGIPVTASTLFALASVTKPITAAVVMALVDDGLVSLEEPIVRFVPEFANPASDGNPQWEAARRLISVRQALAHTTGLPEDLPPGALRGQSQPELNVITDALLQLPLQFEPGTELRYSNAGYALLGRLVARVTGKDIWDFSRSRLLDPMNLDNIVARPGPELDDRIAHVQDAGGASTEHEQYQSQYWRDLAIPWGGLLGTAADIAIFAEQFSTPTNLPLSTRARELMTSDQANGIPGGLTSLKLVWNPAFWGLGWEIKGSKRRHWTGDYTSPATYCHWGAAGTLAWTDPTLKLTVAMFGNRTSFNQWPFSPIARWARLSNLIIAAVAH